MKAERLSRILKAMFFPNRDRRIGFWMGVVFGSLVCVLSFFAFLVFTQWYMLFGATLFIFIMRIACSSGVNDAKECSIYLGERYKENEYSLVRYMQGLEYSFRIGLFLVLILDVFCIIK